MKYQWVGSGLVLIALLSGCGGSGGKSDGSGDSSPRDPAVFGSGENFVNFESGQVRPLAMSDNGDRLFVTNTPNATLDIFSVGDEGLTLQQRVPVGLEPVAVAVRDSSEVWVVNHLSDSISVVDVSVEPALVVNTLHTGDEPRDIVFAGVDRNLAFISAAHRGQNGPDDNPIDAQLETAGVGRADVWVFDAEATGNSLGGDPVTVLNMFGDSLRALATSSDGKRVYAAVMHSGNRTTAVGENRIAKHGPQQSAEGAIQPDTGLIVQFDGQQWVDETGAASDGNDSSYNSMVPFSLPDYDVFVIEADRTPTVLNRLSGVGTTLFDMAENPASGELYISNTEALNVNRFEGMGLVASSVRGNFVRNRVTVISDGEVLPVELNKHLDHSAAATDAERELSVAQPMGMAISGDGSKLYVAGFGSKKIAVYDTAELGNNSFNVSESMQVALSGGGPTGIVLDEGRNRLYALTRFNNHISIVDIENLQELASVPLFNPEPSGVIAGRQFLYDASDMSSHGDASCASCHIFGDTDSLAWDLGNPDVEVVNNPNEFVNDFLSPDTTAVFHPMKGPMSTQSLRGLTGAGPMHWRGDRTGQSASGGESLESAAFKEFNVAFPELLGRGAELTERQIDQFAEFALTMTYPPNPIRALDNSLTASQQAGRDIYFDDFTTGQFFHCNDCHTLDPENGHFGTSGQSSVEGPDISQQFKVPHLRNMYQKVGKFGNTGRFSSDDSDAGDQIRGFGFMHDGNMDTLDNFFEGDVFRFDRDRAVNAQKRAQVVDFVMAFDSDMAPVVGQQVTLTSQTIADSEARADLLMQRAAAGECDLIVKTVLEGLPRGYLFKAADSFQSDRGEAVSYEALTQQSNSSGNPLTFTCVPPGSGIWLGIDRNQDGVLDGEG